MSAAQAARYVSLLSEAEIARNQRYRFARDRHRDLVARALLRTSLAQRFDADPAELDFTIDTKGKPHLGRWPGSDGNPNAPASLCFNLSHTGDWVVLVIAPFRVGVDIEHTPRQNDVLAIARHYFFGKEVEQLFAFPASEQRERFFDYWTLKEAYMKARGEGISLGLSNFGFTLPDVKSRAGAAFEKYGAIELYTEPCLNDNPQAWRFICATPEPAYRLAIAARTEQAFALQCEEVVPLVERSELRWQLR
ncbi:MAG: 4'-phosphopantetheinyl transferase superfamily protein [Pseudomonadales bacterium]|nr:4'-phosphopantetheinyl transferase superfamily protein [Pseudomonadales bacterium]